MVDTSDIFHNSLPLAPERPATVFLSYRRGDIEEVKYLQRWLKVYGMRAWRDLPDMLLGGVSEDEVTFVIEESDAFVIYVTHACLDSDFIWDIEVRAALRRWERDHSFKIVPILCGPTLDDLQRVCMARGLRSLTQFNSISLPASGTDVNGEEFSKGLREVANRVLKAALSQRLRRVGAERSYEPVICLRTFPDKPHTSRLDLDLNWMEFFPNKAQLPPDTAWRDVLFPALNDVKDTLGEMVSSHCLHMYVQAILPVAFAFGYAFPEVAHFTLLLEGPHGTWSTAGTTSTVTPLRCLPSTTTGDKRTALVEIAISRDTAFEMAQSVSDFHLSFSHHLRFEPLNGPDNHNAVENPEQALAMSRQIGRELRRLCDTKGIRHVHLFAALPAALAVMVGHQLNAVSAVTLYHQVPGNGYLRTCTLGTLGSSA